MSKGPLIEAVFKQHSLANKTGKSVSKAAIGRIVDSVFEQVGKQIVGKGYFRYPGFGSFLIKDRSARTVFRALPKTKGQAMDRSEANKITVPARGVVGFKPAPPLKESVKDLKRVKRAKVAKKEKEIV